MKNDEAAAVSQKILLAEDDNDMRRFLVRAQFGNVKVWLDTPPQNRGEGAMLGALRHIAFNWVPFAWFFQREVFAVGTKA